MMNAPPRKICNIARHTVINKLCLKTKNKKALETQHKKKKFSSLKK